MNEESRNPLSSFIFPLIAIILGLIVDVTKKKVSIPLPESVLLFLIAAIASLLLHLFLDTDIINDLRHNYLWLEMEPNAILGILLPPLLFESAFKMNMSFFLFRKTTIIILTLFAYIFTATIVSSVYEMVFKVISGWTPVVARILACILVSTDPVAVVSILESMGASLRLRILIEGESLLNDGLAIFGFKFFVRSLKQEENVAEEDDDDTLIDTLTYLTRCIFMSPLVGVILGRVTLWIMVNVEENKRKQCVLLICVYISYQICDMVGSGALGLVCMGLAISYLKEELTAETTQMSTEFWSTLGYIANNIIFVFAGVMIASELINIDSGRSGQNDNSENLVAVVCGFFLAPFTMIARALAISFIFMSVSKMHQSHRKASSSDYALLSFGGLRGALGLILAMEFRNEMKKTGDAELSVFGREMFIVTSFSTFYSLVLQGCLFGPFAKAEEQTKRSVYTDESNKTMYVYLKRKTKEIIENRMNTTDYLVGTNWKIVLDQANLVLKDKSVYQPYMEKIGESEEDDDENSVYEEEQVLDVRSGFYHCLLARVHSSWERGAISGRTAHVIIRIIEHGLDEGGLELNDFTEHLNHIDASDITIKMTSLIRKFAVFLNKWKIFRHMVLPNSKGLYIDNNKNDKEEIKCGRAQEKWFLFIALVSSIQTYFIIDLFINGGDREYHIKVIFFLLLMSFFVICEKILTIVYITKNCPKQIQRRANENENSFHIRSAEISEQIVKNKKERLLLLSFLPIHIVMASCVFRLLINRDQCIIHRDDTSQLSNECFITMLILVIVCVQSTLYRLFRGFFIGVILLSETLSHYLESRERVRLSVLNYLLHMSETCKISRELFPIQAYITVRQEQKNFVKTLDALLRLELKKNVGFISVIPVMKTRQAIRMLATDLLKEINLLKEDGILREDSVWPSLMLTLRSNSELVLKVPQLSIRDWLFTIPWVKQICNTDNRKKLVSVIENSMKNDDGSMKMVTYQPHEIIRTEGKKMFFIWEGVCKTREWIDMRKVEDPEDVPWRHHSYIQQGQFIGERNLLLIGRKATEPFHVKWPKIHYEAVTRIRGYWVKEDLMSTIVRADFTSIRPYLSERMQYMWMKTEIKHLERQFEEMDYETFHAYFQTHGRFITKEETIHIGENRIAIVGCWTKIIHISSEDRSILTRNYHIIGPTKIIVKPIDDYTKGMVVLRKYIHTLKRNYDPNESEKSVMSISIAS